MQKVTAFPAVTFLLTGVGENGIVKEKVLTHKERMFAMKKALLVILALVLALSVLGCNEKKEEATANNDVFTDELLEGLKQVSLMGLTGPVSGEEMEPIIELLQNVSLAPAGDYLPVEEKPVLLILGFEDGTSKTLSISSTIIAFNEIGADNYLVGDEDFFTEFIKAFGVGEE